MRDACRRATSNQAETIFLKPFYHLRYVAWIAGGKKKEKWRWLCGQCVLYMRYRETCEQLA